MDSWQQVKQERERLGVSQRQFATVLGITATRLGVWERGGRAVGDELKPWVAYALKRCKESQPSKMERTL